MARKEHILSLPFTIFSNTTRRGLGMQWVGERAGQASAPREPPGGLKAVRVWVILGIDSTARIARQACGHSVLRPGLRQPCWAATLVVTDVVVVRVFATTTDR